MHFDTLRRSIRPSLLSSHLLTQPEYKVADPICTFLFSVFVLATTLTILRDVFRILMEGKVFTFTPVTYSFMLCKIFTQCIIQAVVYKSHACRSGAPKGVEFNSVKEVLLSLKAVKAMHSLHLWGLTLGHSLISVHIAIGKFFFLVNVFLRLTLNRIIHYISYFKCSCWISVFCIFPFITITSHLGRISMFNIQWFNVAIIKI